jgi:hypothetical protein
MKSNKIIQILLSVILIAGGGLIIYGAMLPIGTGIIDYGFLRIDLDFLEFNFNIVIITIQYNFLLNKFVVDLFNPFSITALLGIEGMILEYVYSTGPPPIIILPPLIIIIMGIIIAILGILKLLKELGIIKKLDAFFGSRRRMVSIIFIITGGVVISFTLAEYLIFRNIILRELKSGMELFELLYRNDLVFQLTIEANPLAGFYLMLIPAIGIEAISIYLLISARAPEEAPTRAKTTTA